MVTVYTDLVEGSSASYTKEGWVFTREFKVSELTTGNQQQKFIIAKEEVEALTGPEGTAHPNVPNAVLTGFNCSPESSECVKVSVAYKEEGKGQVDSIEGADVEVGTSLSQAETNMDANGAPIILEYTYPEDYKLDPKKARVSVDQGGTVSKLIPESTINYSRREAAAPGAKSKAYVGKVNQGPWSLDPGALPRQWLCSSITGKLSGSGGVWMVSYVFLYRSDTWNQHVFFVNPDDGKPPVDLVDQQGELDVQVYEEADFDQLGL